MFRKFHHAVSLTVITVLTPILLTAMLGTAQAQIRTETQPDKAALAAAAPTYSFGTAAGPVADLIQIDAKSSNWFKFKYRFDNSDSDNVPTQALVRLEMETPGCVTFEVWTPGRLRDPQHSSRDDDNRNDRVTPVGSGTPELVGTMRQSNEQRQQVFDALTLTWAGSAKASDTYYVVVKNKTTAACNYSLSISGTDVSF
jgi:hypothetical protein